MAQINVNSDDKDWFDDFAGDRTQAEAFEEMVQIVRTFDGEPVDVEQLADELEHGLVSNVHLAAYRGVKEYMEGDE